MHLFDTIALIVILYSVVRGYFRGLLREAFNLVGIIAGGLIAVKISPYLALFFQNIFNLSISYSKVIAFILIWILVYTVVFFIGIFLHKLIKLLFLEWIDKTGGIIFGLVKGFLIVGLVLISLLKIPFLPTFKEEVKRTKIVKYIAKSTPEIYNKIIDINSFERFENYENLIKNNQPKKIEKEDPYKELLKD